MKQNNTWIDYKGLKKRVSMRELLGHYDLLSSMKQRKDELIGFCPFHKESKPSFHVSLVKNAFQCFGCHAKGNIFDFVCQMESVGLREAGMLISQWFGSATGSNASPRAKQGHTISAERGGRAENEENTPLKFDLKLESGHPYLKERGLDDETIGRFGLGFCTRGLLKGRIAIPIHNSQGELVAYAGRWPGDPPEGEEKYKLPPGFKKYLTLFNFYGALKEAENGELVLVEGFFDCARVWQSGVKGVVALMGTAFSKEQEDMLAGQFKTVSLMLDRDEAGRKANQEILPRLAKRVFTRVIELPSEGDQPDSLDKKTLITLLKI